MRKMLILSAVLAVAVMCMASKCNVGDKTLPQKTTTEQSK